MADYHKGSLLFTTKFKFLLVTLFSAIIVLGLKTYGESVGARSVLGADTEVNNQQQDQNNKPDVGELNQVQFTAENREQIMLGADHSTIEVSSADGHLNIRARHQDGTETQLRNESLGKLNQVLEKSDLEIATNSENGFFLKHGAVEAKSHFPLSINPDTNELTVTTPAGSKVVAVLPDQAVENLIRQKFIDAVASGSASTGVDLDFYASQSAYLINGILHKKFLGLIPVNIAKSAYVSTENGKVLNTNQSFLSQLLNLFSF